jgi:hypothetical protein
VDAWSSQPAVSSGGAGGSGIVIVKELNKASGSWPLRAQFSSIETGNVAKFLLQPFSADYLVIAGGGSGAGATGVNTGGGGAGGYRTSGFGPAPLRGSALTLSGNTNYPVVIGGGGALKTGGTCAAGSQGTPSSFAAPSPFGITSTGGGGGASYAANNGTTWWIRWRRRSMCYIIFR